MKTVIVSLKKEFKDQVEEIAEKIAQDGFAIKKFSGCTIICQTDDIPGIGQYLHDMPEVRSWMEDRPLELIQPVNRIPRGL